MTANVILRQFWSAVDPPAEESQTLGGPTTLQAKAVRMAGHLTKTPEKVAAIIRYKSAMIRGGGKGHFASDAR
jgi:hypothetical protein